MRVLGSSLDCHNPAACVKGSMAKPLILVVDDEAPARKYLAANLRTRGYDVLTAADGEAALALLAEHPVALLLLDLGLPGLDGFEVLSTIRRKHNGHPPVVVCSARTGHHDQATALSLGAAAYLTKPFSVQDLLTEVCAILPLPRT